MTEKVRGLLGYDVRIFESAPKGSPKFAASVASAEVELQRELGRWGGIEKRREIAESSDENGGIYSVNVWYEAAE